MVVGAPVIEALGAGRFRAAIKKLKDEIASGRNEQNAALLHSMIGTCHLCCGDQRRASIAYRTASRLDPTDLQVAHVYGRFLLFYVRRYADAARVLEQAIPRCWTADYLHHEHLALLGVSEVLSGNQTRGHRRLIAAYDKRLLAGLKTIDCSPLLQLGRYPRHRRWVTALLGRLARSADGNIGQAAADGLARLREDPCRIDGGLRHR